jgi:hypothetical protein
MSGVQMLSLAMPIAALDLPFGAIEKGGVVTVLIIAVVAIWREGNKRQDKLEGIIDRNTKALTEAAEVDRESAKVLVEVKDEIIKCHAARGHHERWNGQDERRGQK